MTTDLERLDALLGDVSLRSTVYEHEIITPLLALEHQATSATVWHLAQHVSEINGDRYLHAREFINALLDLRLEITT